MATPGQYYNMFGPSYRGDVPVVGEIKPMVSGSGGDVFVMATIRNGGLYLPARRTGSDFVLNEQNHGSTGVLVAENEYVWSESAITYYLQNAGASGINVTSDPNWAYDFFKWEYVNQGTQSGIAFRPYSDPYGVNPAQAFQGITNIQNAGVSFEIIQKNASLCNIAHPDKENGSDYDIWFFQPRLSLMDSALISYNDPNVLYPCCANNTNTRCPEICQAGYTQCVAGSTYSGVFNASYPGMDREISGTTKMYAGTIYDTNVDVTAYSSIYFDFGGGPKDNACGKTSLYGRQTFMYASSYLKNGGKYDGLPLGLTLIPDTKADNSDYDKTSVRLYHNTSNSNSAYSDTVRDCNGSNDSIVAHVATQDRGFTFFLIPVQFFEKTNCQILDATSLIYSACYPYYKNYQGDSLPSWYKYFCGDTKNSLIIQTGYSNYQECFENQGVYPYVYPSYCYDSSGELVNSACGTGTFPTNTCSVKPDLKYANPMNVLGETITTSIQPYNSVADTSTQCCQRTTNNASNSSITITSLGTCYNPGQACIGPDDPEGCYWLTPDKQIVCDSSHQDNCVNLCTYHGETNCQNYACTDSFQATGCVETCNADTVDDSTCWYWYPSNDGTTGNWICKNETNDPNDCLTPCLSSKQTGCTPLICSNFGTYPEYDCFPDCGGDINSNCYYNGTFICGVSGPAGCKSICGNGVNSNCITPNCLDLSVTGCLNECSAGENSIVDDCYYTDYTGNWICNGTDDPPDCTPVCTPALIKNGTTCFEAYCDSTNVPGCITACKGTNDPEGCIYQATNTGTGPWWICEQQGIDYPEGCVDICSTGSTGLTANCKRVTCDSAGVQIPNCFPTTPQCTGGVWDDCWYYTTQNGTTPVCTSVNFPSGCVMQCDGSSTTGPTWGNTDKCTTVSCYGGTTEPGNCSTTGGGGGGGDGGGGDGIPFWVWIIVALVGLIIVGIVAFFAIRSYSASDDDDDTDSTDDDGTSSSSTTTTSTKSPPTTTSS